MITLDLFVKAGLFAAQIVMCAGHGRQVLFTHFTQVVLLPDIGRDGKQQALVVVAATDLSGFFELDAIDDRAGLNFVEWQAGGGVSFTPAEVRDRATGEDGETRTYDRILSI